MLPVVSLNPVELTVAMRLVQGLLLEVGRRPDHLLLSVLEDIAFVVEQVVAPLLGDQLFEPL